MTTQCNIRVFGIVQGVGFRPHVWDKARRYQLNGKVHNDTQGVHIIVQGKTELIELFIHSITQEAPQQAHISRITHHYAEPDSLFDCFSIAESHQDDTVTAGISPDLVTCSKCKEELFDPSNPRFAYPFINCTHCGPRLSIIRALPYDRCNTSMAAFALCGTCQQEYDSPEDRRFHAQPNACPTCGPTIWLVDNNGDTLAKHDVIAHAAEHIRSGKIVAIKGIGGYQLCVDATNSQAVNELRQRKQRPHKPFALMAKSINCIEQYCVVDTQEQEQLLSAAGPIVLLRKRQQSAPLKGIAEQQSRLGFMLPTSPLHWLLLAELDMPVVMTSANTSGQPQCTDNDVAMKQLSDIADSLLMHNRDINQRIDDSVLHIVDSQPQLLRRARGYAPKPITLPQGFETGDAVLAMGGDLKNTFCLLDEQQAIVSQHMGDLSDLETEKEMGSCLRLYQQIRHFSPTIIAVDQHPHYRSRSIGYSIADQTGAKVEAIQHHHAHIAACMAENGYPRDGKPVLGICLDGMGFAQDSAHIWGGEILYADYCTARQIATLKPTALPGGDLANKQPWRNAVAHLHHVFDWPTLLAQRPNWSILDVFRQQQADVLVNMINSNTCCPLTSSAGRLFDAVAAALGMCSHGEIDYEGKAAMELEACIVEQDWLNASPYRFNPINHNDVKIIDPAAMWSELVDDIHQGKSHSAISARFHLGLAQVYATATSRAARQLNVDTVVLSGGVMQNYHLQTNLIQRLKHAGLDVLVHHHVPANDGGLSLGQAVIARARQIRNRMESLCA